MEYWSGGFGDAVFEGLFDGLGGILAENPFDIEEGCEDVDYQVDGPAN